MHNITAKRNKDTVHIGHREHFPFFEKGKSPLIPYPLRVIGGS